jgi:tetratricopeptide (TPR) repeat protein
VTEREELLAIITRRIEEGPEGLSGYLDVWVVAEAMQLVQILHDDGGTVEEWHRLGVLHWLRYVHPEGGFGHDLFHATRAFAQCFVAGAEDLPEPLLPALADEAENDAFALLQSAMASAALRELSEAVRLWERIVSVTSIGHPRRINRLNCLGGLLRARSEQAGSEDDFDRAIKLFREALSAAPPGDPQLALIHNNLGAAFQIRFERTGSSADLDLAIDALHKAAAFPQTSDLYRDTIVPNLADALQSRVSLLGDPHDLDEAIRYRQEAIEYLAPGNPDRYRQLANLGVSLRKRYARSGSRADLDAAADALQTAVEGSDRARYFDSLGMVLYERFSMTDALADLDAAIEVLSAAVAPDSEHDPADRSVLCTNLGVALAARAGRLDIPEDLDRAIVIFREVNATSLPRSPVNLCNLGGALIDRFVLRGETDDIEAAIRVFQDACTLATDSLSADTADSAVLGLARALKHRYERRGSLDDLNTSIDLLHGRLGGLPDDHPSRIKYLTNLGILLESRFGRLGTIPDLDLAIHLHKRAKTLAPVDHPDRAHILNGLGTALRVRYRRLGVRSDLDEAIEHLSEAVVTATKGVKAFALLNLGTALGSRFNRAGDIADLDAAVDAHRAASVLADRANSSMMLSGLGQSLLNRFQHLGDPDDLDAAIEAGSQAVTSTPADDPERPRYLSHLGNLFEARFDQLQRLSDADAAITHGREAVRATPDDHFERAGYLLCLGNILWKRYGVLEDNADLDAAVEVAQEALRLTPEDSAERGAVLNLLSGTLTRRFQRCHEKGDIDEAIIAARTAVDSAPPGHRNLTIFLIALGNALHSRFERFGAPEDSAQAMSVFERVVAEPLAAPSLRVRAARVGAGLLAEHEPTRAAELLASAVRLLPEVAPRRLKRLYRQDQVGRFSFLASEAAALILSDSSRPEDERATRALQTLETGRGVLLSQTLETRSDITDLREAHPELAARFEELRDAMDAPADPSAPTGERERHAAELSALLGHIRGLTGFASFGLSPTLEDLLNEAAYGPVVTINVSTHRGDALILTTECIRSIELPGLNFETLFEQVSAFSTALEDSLHAETSITAHRDASARLNRVLRWLWDVVTGPILDALGLAPADDLPRVWWVPGGLLNVLPLHAAGYHTEGSTRTVMDRVISSYIPTIRALGHARQLSKPGSASDRSLVVAMPTTPGRPDGDLPQARAEAAKVERRLPAPITLTEPNGPPGPADQIPTAETTLGHLADCAFAHFICHGVSDPDDPAQSRLLLHDHRERPLTVASLAAITLGNARLAYLSACETALSFNARLLDEAIHLAGAFQLAGFPHVIGTFWTIFDSYSTDIAESFYRHLSNYSNDTLNTDEAARALHAVIRNARDESPLFAFRWAAYLHTGA